VMAAVGGFGAVGGEASAVLCLLPGVVTGEVAGLAKGAAALHSAFECETQQRVHL